MVNKQKLELTWIGKDTPIKVEPRILVHDPTKDYGDKNTDNMLIYGDNLLALKALEQDYAGKIKCIYIDPPYNTGSAFEHYDDNLEHSIWLSLMKARLEILHNLLADDGSIYINIDNNEIAYLKVLLDEIFTRKNFVQLISVKRASPAGFKVINPGPLTVTDYILLYAKNKEKFLYNPQRIPVDYDENYDMYIINPNDPPEEWKLGKLVDLVYQKHHITNWKEAKELWGEAWKNIRRHFLADMAIEKREQVVSVRDPHKPSDKIKALMAQSKKNPNKLLVFYREGKKPVYIYNGGALSFYKEKLREFNGQLRPTELLTDFWGDINFAGIASEGGVQFKNSKKPEMLVERVLALGSNSGDLVLDSFLGSGTTAAVAHKMGRKYIGIELGEHCHTHCIPRLQKVIDGTDQGGISKAVNWHGGGGFKYYYLAPSLLNKDKYGQYVISKEYNADMLAAAVAKNEGFKYAPSQEQFWKQGQSSEADFIYTTTNHVGAELLSAIAQDMKPGESLLICCKSFDSGLSSRFANITVKKIPAALLGRCEFGKDNYNLNIINPPVLEEEEE